MPFIGPIIQFFAEYLKGKPTTDVLLIVGIGVFLYMESNRRDTAATAHATMRQVLHDRDEYERLRTEANAENTERIINALTGLKTEVKGVREETKKIPAVIAPALGTTVPAEPPQ